MKLRWDKRRTGFAASATVPVLVGILALTQQGFPVARLDLDDGGVWLTSQTNLALGRFNVPVAELDGGIGTTSAQFDVLQDASNVVLVEGTQLSVVDPATVAVTERGTVQAGSTVQMASGTVVVGNAQGQIWIRDLHRVEELGVDTPPDVDLGSGGRAVATTTGVVVAVATDGKTFTTTPDKTSPAEPMAGSGEIDQLTAVGNEPVALDGSTVRTRHGEVTLPGTGLVLQQPGPAHASVLVSGTDALYEVPLDGGEPVVHSTGSSGVPAAPVFVAGCAYGAWAAPAGNWLRICGDVIDTADRDDITATDSLVFRVNRSQVVLNDAMSGRAWMPQDTAATTPNWDQIQPEPDQEPNSDEGEEPTQDQTAECSEEGNPPIATDDDYGVRPGRPTTLRVLANDSTSDCGILVVSAVDSVPAEFGVVRTVEGGRALEIDVAPNAKGSVSFTYTITDHPGSRAPATATVRVSVHDLSQNSPPVQVSTSSIKVGQGSSLSTAVLSDFVDPDGDPLTLVGATMDPTFGSVSFRPDGVVTVIAAGQVGATTATLVVSDGIAADPVEGTMDISVLEGSVSPLVGPVHAVGFVNQPLVVNPMAAVRSSGAEPPRLAGVGDVVGASVVPDLPAGTFTFTAPQAGTYYVSFVVVSSPDQTIGWARIDVLDFPTQIEPPIPALDIAYLRAGGTTTIDPLANDADPNNLVLGLQSVTVPEGSGLRAAVVNHELVEVFGTRTLTEPVTILYAVSNGGATSTGTILVVPVSPSASNQPPVVADREVTVRTGGVVTVSVLDGAYDPDGDEVWLDPDLVEIPDGDGLLFVSGDVLRYKAPETERTVTATFQIKDAGGATSSAILTVHVRRSEADSKPAPTPHDLVARVYSGESVRIPVPLTGIDVDGDGVTLLGLGDSAPQHGVVSQVGSDYLVYDALSNETGTDTFTYAVEDWTGQRAVATVRVGIIARPSDAPIVVARDDSVSVLPGSTVEVAVLTNDVDSSADLLELDPLLSVSGEGVEDQTVKAVDGFIVVRAPHIETVLQVQYTARDGRGGQDSAVLTVTVTKTAPVLPPIAKDVVVPAIDTIGRTQVEVDVLAVASNPSGPLSELEVSIPDVAEQAAEVTTDSRVLVTLSDEPQIIPYQLINTRDPSATAFAFITVPALGFFPPQLRPKAPDLRVGSGQSITIELAQQVQVAPGRSPNLADAASIKATGGNGEAISDHAVTFTADADYSGPASVTVKVTDATGPDDEQARQATLTIPITVYATDEHPPTFAATTIQVGAGDPPLVIDLTAFMKDPEGNTPKESQYTYTRVGSVPSGFTASLSGSRLTVSATPDSPKGTTGSLALAIGYGATGSLDVAVPLRVVASAKPLARVVDQVRTDAQAGQPYQLNVLADAYNPFAPDGELTVVGVVVETAGSGTATFSGEQVTVHPIADFVGDMVVRFVVRDATNDPDREVEGRITLRVASLPDAPAAPRIVEVADGAVTLAWNAPDAKGASITGYRATASDGTVAECPATTCTIDGLNNGTSYTFTVAAHNPVGWSPESPESASAIPDAVPDAPEAPHLTSGDGSIRADWAVPVNHGSAIVSYEVQISPAPDDPTDPSVVQVTIPSARFDGLTNGKAYQVRVRAYNASPQPGAWSQWSSSAAPATVPGQPGGFQAARVDTQAGGQIELHWITPSGNGMPLGAYTLQISGGGTSRTVHPGPSDTSWVMMDANNGVAYTFTLRATNAIGSSAPAVASASTYGTPSTPVISSVIGQAGGAYGQGTAKVTWSPAVDNGSPITSYLVRINGGELRDVGTSTSTTIGSLPGGHDVSVQVQACNVAGCSDWSGSRGSDPDPSTVPGSVSGLSVQVQTDPSGSPTMVNANWSQPDWAGATGGHEYLVTLLVDGAPVGSTFSTGTNSAQFVNGLPTLNAGRPSATITVSVAARSSVGTGNAESRSQTVTWIAPPPDVTGLNVTVTGYDFSATWNPVSGADHYEWQLVEDGVVEQSGNATVTQATTHEAFGHIDVVVFRVRAVDASGHTSQNWTSVQVNP